MRYKSKEWREDKTGFVFGVTWLVQVYYGEEFGWATNSSHSSFFSARDFVVDTLKTWKESKYYLHKPADIRLVKMEEGMYD